MARLVDNVVDFKKVMEQCLENYNDNSQETRRMRVDDWLWITKSNRTINESDDYSDEDYVVKMDLSEVMNQVSNFVDIEDKKIYCLYLIMNSPELAGDIRLSTELASESLNNDNAAVNTAIDAWSHTILRYDELIMNKQIEGLTKILGEDKVNEIKFNAKRALEIEGVSNLIHYLARDYENDESWPSIKENVTIVKGVYRERVRGKEQMIFNSTSIAKTMTIDEFKLRAFKLRNTIKDNLTSEGVRLSGTAL